jgi:hypothetical protein
MPLMSVKKLYKKLKFSVTLFIILFCHLTIDMTFKEIIRLKFNNHLSQIQL